MSEKKKILIFIDWFLPGYKAGGPIRSVANIIDTLHKSYDFYIVTSDRDYLETNPYKNIIPNKWINFESKAKVCYISDNSLNKTFFSNLVKNNKFEIIYINGIYSYYFSILPLRIMKNTKIKKIVAPRGMLSGQGFSSKRIKKFLYVKTAKILGLYKNVIFHATNENEASDIKKRISKSSKILITPNLTRSFTMIGKVKREKQKGTIKLVSIARISIEKNTLFSLKILNSIKYEGKIEYDLYGSIYNNKYWALCKDVIGQLPENITVNYKSSINSNLVNPTYSKYHFAFIPSKGENFGHSIFEALAAGCPVIISDKTPWKNLEEKNIGWDINLENKEHFRDIIVKCAETDQENYNQMSENAYKFAYDYSKNNEHINKTIKLFE